MMVFCDFLESLHYSSAMPRNESQETRITFYPRQYNRPRCHSAEDGQHLSRVSHPYRRRCRNRIRHSLCAGERIAKTRLHDTLTCPPYFTLPPADCGPRPTDDGTRRVHRRQSRHAARLFCDIVTSSLPGWRDTRLWVIARPISGFAESFSQFVMVPAPGGGSDAPDAETGALRLGAVRRQRE